jgi:hypothetical protein
MSNVEKLKALKLTMDKIDKDYGKGYVGGDEEELKKNPHCVGFIAKPVNKTELISLVKTVEASENKHTLF